LAIWRSSRRASARSFGRWYRRFSRTTSAARPWPSPCSRSGSPTPWSCSSSRTRSTRSARPSHSDFWRRWPLRRPPSPGYGFRKPRTRPWKKSSGRGQAKWLVRPRNPPNEGAATRRVERSAPARRISASGSVHAFPRFAGERLQQGQVGFEEVVRGAQNIAAAGAGLFEAAAEFAAGFLGRAAGQEVKLVETADHADAVPDTALGVGQVCIAAHASGREGFHGVGFHGGDALQQRHHASAGVIDDPLPGTVGLFDQFAIVW